MTSTSRAFRDFCGTCHDTPNVGDHSVKAPLDIGIPDAGVNKPPVLDISGLPVFTLTCTQGPLAGRIYKVTDAGKGDDQRAVQGHRQVQRVPFCVGLRHGLRIFITVQRRPSWMSLTSMISGSE